MTIYNKTLRNLSCTCQRSTPGTVATSNTTAQRRLTSSALTSAALAQGASPGRGGRSEVNLMRCTATWAGRFPSVPSTPLASDLRLTWAPAAMAPVLSRSAAHTQRHLPLCLWPCLGLGLHHNGDDPGEEAQRGHVAQDDGGRYVSCTR